MTTTQRVRTEIESFYLFAVGRISNGMFWIEGLLQNKTEWCAVKNAKSMAIKPGRLIRCWKLNLYGHSFPEAFRNTTLLVDRNRFEWFFWMSMISIAFFRILRKFLVHIWVMDCYSAEECVQLQKATVYSNLNYCTYGFQDGLLKIPEQLCDTVHGIHSLQNTVILYGRNPIKKTKARNKYRNWKTEVIS